MRLSVVLSTMAVAETVLVYILLAFSGGGREANTPRVRSDFSGCCASRAVLSIPNLRLAPTNPVIQGLPKPTNET
ncbi:hypothetical protein GQ53DRAFT_349082 [Thozetella sp. PMI_491]|nr:hypothetical protein GQ53DRAFT_349082 [Thozetella sp. PMI_491]